METSTVDPTDDSAFDAWYSVYATATAHGRPDAPLWSKTELRAMLLESPAARTWGREISIAFDDRDAVGIAWIDWPLKDNLDRGEYTVAVIPQARNRGIGAALHEHVAERLAARGRTVLATRVHQPVDGPPQPGSVFLTNRGYTKVNVEARRVLPLPVDADRLQQLLDEAAVKAEGYIVRSWTGRCPDFNAPQYAHLKSLLSSQAPLGESAYEQEVWDVERLRAEEDLLVEQDRVMLTAVAVAPDGSLVGHTQIAVPSGEDVAYQWDTLVLPEHRGHRLGMLLKVTNVQALAGFDPDRAHITTWNALSNGPMNGVNDALGFETVEHTEDWEKQTSRA